MEAWRELNDLDYRTIWDRFDHMLQFRPSTSSDDWPGIKEPSPSVTYSVGHLYENTERDKLESDLEETALAAFMSLVAPDHWVWALDWQHPCYHFFPHAARPDAFVIPAFPNGDYSIFYKQTSPGVGLAIPGSRRFAFGENGYFNSFSDSHPNYSTNRSDRTTPKAEIREEEPVMTFHSVSVRLVFSFTLLVAAPSLHAEPLSPVKLAAIAPRMQQFVDEGTVAGAVTVVGSSKGIVHHEAVGFQNLETKQPLTKDALFRIASMTKPITAIGIMQLQDEGKLSVDDPVEKHLPEFKGQLLIEKRDGDQITLKKPPRPITIRDLLTHTSGLPGGFPPGLSDLYFKRNFSLGEATMMQSQRPLDFEPGSKWAYCNSGIDTLGRIIEVKSGQKYEDYLASCIFKPLGMNDTSPYPDEKQLTRLAGLYGQREGQLYFADYVLIGPTKGARHPIPAGGLFSTGADLAKLYQAMLNTGKLGETRILSEESVKMMTQLQTGDLQCGFTPGMGFGFGWAVVKEPQGVHEMLSKGTFGHGGAFGTQGWIDPGKDLFVILLIQRTGMPNSDASDLRRELQRLAVTATMP